MAKKTLCDLCGGDATEHLFELSCHGRSAWAAMSFRSDALRTYRDLCSECAGDLLTWLRARAGAE